MHVFRKPLLIIWQPACKKSKATGAQKEFYPPKRFFQNEGYHFRKSTPSRRRSPYDMLQTEKVLSHKRAWNKRNKATAGQKAFLQSKHGTLINELPGSTTCIFRKKQTYFKKKTTFLKRPKKTKHYEKAGIKRSYSCTERRSLTFSIRSCFWKQEQFVKKKVFWKQEDYFKMKTALLTRWLFKKEFYVVIKPEFNPICFLFPNTLLLEKSIVERGWFQKETC